MTVACVIYANQLPASSHSRGYSTDIIIIAILTTIAIMEGMLSKMPTVSKVHRQYGKDYVVLIHPLQSKVSMVRIYR